MSLADDVTATDSYRAASALLAAAKTYLDTLDSSDVGLVTRCADTMAADTVRRAVNLVELAEQCRRDHL